MMVGDESPTDEVHRTKGNLFSNLTKLEKAGLVW